MTKRSSITIIAIVIAAVALLFGLNVITAPLIEANGASAELEPLMAVMPDAAGFECVYSNADPAAYSLKDVPESVIGIYKETSGLGYALSLSAVDGYTGETMLVSMAVDNEGKISGINIDVYSGSKDIPADYPSTYIGQDSALGGVSLVAGTTFSSTAFKTAVTDGFNALIANELIGAGVKSDEQILTELMPTVYPGMVDQYSGTAQYTEREAQGAHIVKAFENNNHCGMAYIVKDGDASYLAVVNLSGSCAVFDTEGKDATASVDPAVVDEVKADAAKLTTPNEEHIIKKINAMLGEQNAEIVPVELSNIFSSVTNAYTVQKDGKTLHVFVALPFGYSGNMNFYFIIDEAGAIYAMSADTMIMEADYYSNYTLDENAYKEGFKGVTKDTATDDVSFISAGATYSSTAAHTAMTDSFAAFEILTNGGENNA